MNYHEFMDFYLDPYFKFFWILKGFQILKPLLFIYIQIFTKYNLIFIERTCEELF